MSEQSLQFSVVVSDPLVVGTALVTDKLGQYLDVYSHDIQAMGGYWTANLTFKGNQLDLEEWLANGLGRHVEVYGPSLTKVWEGFVNQVKIRLGGLSVTRGPLTGIANNAALIYSTVDTSTDPPVVGTRETSSFVQDTDSQGLYGIVTKILSSGGIPEDEVTTLLSTYVTENKNPETSQSFSIGSQGQMVLTLECLGYVHWTKLYTYNQTASTGTANLSAIFAAILAADPNSLISTSTVDIDSNTLAVKQYYNDNDVAWKLLSGLVAKGDASFNRYVWGIYDDRVPAYNAIPTTIDYLQYLSSAGQHVETLAGVEVFPWDVRPGRWLQVPDFLIGQSQPSNLREDQRNILIESVTYRMPWQLDIKGGKSDKLPQTLAQLGLGGIGAGV